MVLKRVFRLFDWSGASVETELAQTSVQPGAELKGCVRLYSKKLTTVERIVIDLVARIESGNNVEDVEFGQVEIHGALAIVDDETIDIPFDFPMPWESPFATPTDHSAHSRVTVGLQTEMAITRNIDKSDFDPIAVTPLPAQEQMLNLMRQRGFTITGHTFAEGHSPILGSRNESNFFQAVTYAAPPSAPHVDGVELVFAGEQSGVNVALGAKTQFPGGMHRFHVTHGVPEESMLAQQFDAWWNALNQQSKG